MRSRSGVLLLALVVAALPASTGVAQYTPKWRVGDWWIVKVWERNMLGGMQWRPLRYDVLGVEKVDGARCFVLQRKKGDTTSAREGVRLVYYIRTDNWRIIRMVDYFLQAGKLVGPNEENFPEGMSGFHPFGVWFPTFPLDVAAVQDSAFHFCTTYGASDLRQFSGIADSVLVSRYLSEPNPSGGHPLQPRGGAMFSVLSETGVRRDSITVPSSYSLQLWSSDYPWRLYEEWGPYVPAGSNSRQPQSRSWLVAVGHAEK